MSVVKKILISFVISISLVVSALSLASDENSQTIASLSIVSNPNKASIVIDGLKEPVFSSYTLPNPARLILEFPSTKIADNAKIEHNFIGEKSEALVPDFDFAPAVDYYGATRFVLFYKGQIDYKIDKMPSGRIDIFIESFDLSPTLSDGSEKALDGRALAMLMENELKAKQLEDERIRLEQEKQIEEQKRLELEMLRKQEEENNLRKAEEERKRLEQEQLRKQEEERKRLEQERLRKQEEERKRLEQERLRKQEEERKRLEQERLRKQEEERKRLEQERLRKQEEERNRLEQERLRKQEEERKRLEQERLRKEEEERKRLEQERLRKQEEERKRLEQERLRKQEEKRKRLEIEEAEKLKNLPVKKIRPRKYRTAVLDFIGFHRYQGAGKISLRFSTPVDVDYEWQDNKHIIFKFNPAKITKRINMLPLYTSAFGTPVEIIRPDWSPRKKEVYLRVQVFEKTDISIEQSDSEVHLFIKPKF